MTKDGFLRLLEENLSLDPGALENDRPLSEIHWDSMSVVSFMALVDGHFSGVIEPERIAASQNVSDLVALVEAQLEA
jgi:acyl carrier protein